MIDDTSPVGPGPATADHHAERPLRRMVAALRLGDWSEARGRVLPRVVAAERAGPLAHRLPASTGEAGRELRFDVGLDLSPGPTLGPAGAPIDPSPATSDGPVGGVARIDVGLVRSWGCEPAELWSNALANLVARPIGAAPRAVAGLGGLVVVCDGRWTTGWLSQPSRLGRLVAGDPDQDLLAVAPADDVVLVAPLPTRSGSRDQPAIDLLRAARALRPAIVDPLPLALWPLRRGQPFPPSAILE